MQDRSNLIGQAAKPDPERLRFEVVSLESVDSTNRYILDHARTGASEGLVVVADFQSSGRGRLERAWQAPPKASLLVSILFRPKFSASDLHLLNSLAGVSMVEALMDLYPELNVGLKWPNDLYVGNRKLGGILAESTISANELLVAVGVGLNLDWTSEQLSLLGRPATSISVELGRESIGPTGVLDRFLERLSANHALLSNTDGVLTLTSRYRSKCVTIGQRVAVELPEDSFEGVALDVAPSGELLVAVDSCVRAVATADVVHLIQF